jgi:hypothetical protein
MKTSESIAKIADALAKAQIEMGRVVKDKTAKVQTKAGGSYSFDYADLASVLDVVKPALAKHGIAVVQAAALEGDKVNVETRLLHSSGEWIESALAVKPEDTAPQKIGSAITYARRYALSCMVGVASEEDDDGNAAEGNRATTETKANGAKHAKAADDVRAAMRTPAFRKQEAIREINQMGLDVRATLKSILDRTFPEGQEIKLQSESELEKVEERIVLLRAKHNGERASAHN